MTWYIKAQVMDGDVIGVHCCDLPITHTALEVKEPHIEVSAEIEGEYEGSQYAIQKLSWDGEKLVGYPFIDQTIKNVG